MGNTTDPRDNHPSTWLSLVLDHPAIAISSGALALTLLKVWSVSGRNVDLAVSLLQTANASTMAVAMTLTVMPSLIGWTCGWILGDAYRIWLISRKVGSTLVVGLLVFGLAVVVSPWIVLILALPVSLLTEYLTAITHRRWTTNVATTVAENRAILNQIELLMPDTKEATPQDREVSRHLLDDIQARSRQTEAQLTDLKQSLFERPLVWTARAASLALVFGAVALSSRPWLSQEALTLASGERLSGYVVSTNGDWTSVLETRPRALHFVRTAEIDARELCGHSDGYRPETLLALVVGSSSADLPDCE